MSSTPKESMTSRERVRRCLELDHPDRVPRELWSLPLAVLVHGQEAFDAFNQRWPSDTVKAASPNPALVARRQGKPYEVGQYRDEWGCLFENVHRGIIGEVKVPLIDDWSKLEDLRLPVEAWDVDRDKVNAFCRSSDRFVFADCTPRLFERLQFLRGTENVYMDLAEDSPEFLELLRRVHEFHCKELESWVKTEVDGVRFMDDWGSQRSLLINPEQWRRVFKPLYAEFVRIAHAAGKKIFMHSDGYIFDVYEDLIEIGLDAVNSQLFCMDIEEIARRFKGRITFWGEIDRQRVLPFGTVADCQAAVQRVVEALWQPAGGVLAQFEMSNGPMANYDATYQAWLDLPRARAQEASA